VSATEVLILGAGGGFGRLLARLLADAGYRVTGVDPRLAAGAPAEGLAAHLVADASVTPGGALLERVSAADWVVSCMPSDATMRAFASLSPAMRGGAMFMDVLSVKEPICRLMAEGRGDIQCLSVHPMFAPSAGFANQNVALVRVRPGPSTARAEALIAGWGARTHVLTAREHDTRTAMVQAATHAAILAFGMALESMGYRAGEVLPLSTPPHRILLALVARIATGNPDVYRQIQTENPLAAAARAALADAAARLDRIAAADDPAAIAELFQSLRPMLDDHAEPLLRLGGALVAASAGPV
jgi:prephenate dehydrogenase